MSGSNRDTIMALATPYGVAAMAKLRVSGPRTRELIRTIFRRREWQARHVYFAPFWDKSGKILDEVCWFFFEGRRSYTGEDSLEIDAHGNPLIIRKVLEDLEGRGCRLAEPGEFTRRAFLNHKIDLCQAEAVLDLIHAPHDEALALASEQLSGHLSRKISEWRERLLGLLASIELGIDFPSEAEEEAAAGPPIGATIESLLEEMRGLRAMQGAAERLKRGLRIVLVGEPNAGKSSLFNRLLRQERALVDAGAGTTRDFIGANWICAGQILELIDTAGLRDPESDLERRGIERSLALLEKADLALWVVDPREPECISARDLRDHIALERLIRVENKCDLGREKPSAQEEKPALEALSVSARTGEGIGALCRKVAEKIQSLTLGSVPSYGINERHAGILRRVEEVLMRTRDSLRPSGLAAECLASDLRLALEILGEMTGPYEQEALLDRLFSQFCIGK
ncbi:MAG: tRNA uridine-5-carboxymethylaminomethyl(34) synthesis GTPase MnmE [Puniceicoccales bacterium]|nr:tRNA uridine-5-carboxymethylaminomethyl(34) synthesis GTPase MnmE [Puniceicoccales bacterium]